MHTSTLFGFHRSSWSARKTNSPFASFKAFSKLSIGECLRGPSIIFILLSSMLLIIEIVSSADPSSDTMISSSEDSWHNIESICSLMNCWPLYVAMQTEIILFIYSATVIQTIELFSEAKVIILSVNSK